VEACTSTGSIKAGKKRIIFLFATKTRSQASETINKAYSEEVKLAKLKDHDEKYLRHFLRDSRKSVKRTNKRRIFFLDLLEGALNKKQEGKK